MESRIKGIRILAVDDEPDILETIIDLLNEADVDTAQDYQSASHKIKHELYDLAILDIMGVNGFKLLEETVAKGIPTVMLTAHAINPDAMMESIRKGAIAYLPKETLVELDELLDRILSAHDRGEPPWKLLFEKLEDYFDARFGKDWMDEQASFWNEFKRTYRVGEGIKKRLLHDERIINKGI